MSQFIPQSNVSRFQALVKGQRFPYLLAPLIVTAACGSPATRDEQPVPQTVTARMCAGIEGCAALVQGTTLSPNSNGGSGALPSGYAHLTFNLADGDWTDSLLLPTAPADGAEVLIHSSAQYTSSLDLKNVDLPMEKLVIRNGDTFRFVFHAATGKWTIEGSGVSYLSPNTMGAEIPVSTARIIFYNMADGDWAESVKLPPTATDGGVVVIRSQATWASRVHNQNLMYNSTHVIQTGDEYVFVYSEAYQRWMLESSTIRHMTAEKGAALVGLTSPNTQINFDDEHYVPSLMLPSQPGDRDRIRLHSASARSTTINGSNISGYSALTLNKGDDYEFMYAAERKGWVVTRYPTTEYQAREITEGILPKLVRLRTRVSFADGNWVRDLQLPESSPVGYRVVVESQATWSFSVRGAGSDSTPTTNVRTGDTIVFVVDEQGKWKQETVTIDMLLLYSDKAAQRIGEAQERNRMLEGLRLTNEALENSRANFRVRMVGLEMVPARDHWTILDHPLSDLRTDEAVQKRRNELRADAIYYEGTEDGCGLAWVNRGDPQTSSMNMVGTGSLHCGTTVMRHEFGHNMGLNHGVNTNDTSGQYWVGNSRVGTIMGGNQIPFYSSPNLYSRHGVPLGVEGQVDAVRAMNEFSATVAGFR